VVWADGLGFVVGVGSLFVDMCVRAHAIVLMWYLKYVLFLVFFVAIQRVYDEEVH
jgi:hypothetical protein